MRLNIRNLSNTVQSLNEKQGTFAPAAQKQLAIFGFNLVAMAQIKSPVDTGRFKAAWQVQRFIPSGAIAGIMISNNLPYAGPLEYGSPAGKPPWPSAGPKTVEQAGRIYSSQAPGGVLSPSLPAQAKKIAEAVLRGIQ